MEPRQDASSYLISLANRGEMSPGTITLVTCDNAFAVQFKGGIRLNRCRQLKHPACTTNPKKLESLRCLRTTNCSTVCGSAVVCIPSPSGAGWPSAAYCSRSGKLPNLFPKKRFGLHWLNDA